MTKKELAKQISDELGVEIAKCLQIVQKTFDGITDTLESEGRIELRNFGVFQVKKRKERTARNPRTGEKVFVPERYVVSFKPGRGMEERIGKAKMTKREAEMVS